MDWSTCSFIFINLIVFVDAGGTMKIALETFRFEVKLGSNDDTTSGTSQDNTVLTDIDYVKDFSPQWKIVGATEQDEDDSNPVITDQSYGMWPWDGPTNCFSPVRFRFLLCLDYADRYDPSRLCQLARIISNRIELARDRFTNTVLGRKKIDFGGILRNLRDGDFISNPVELEFDDWKGPLRLAVYVNCCGGTRFITDRCDDVMTTTLSLWPQSLTKGIQSMRYSMEGKGSLTFSVSANCETDYYGINCDVYCKVENPVLDHAFCNSTTGERSCMKGWDGLKCQIDVDECRGIVCKNGGTCKNSRGTFSCTCPFGTRGRRCEKRYPVCHLGPCQHQGTCLETTAGALCFCMPGFEGQWCHLLESDDNTSRKISGQGSKFRQGNSAMATLAPVRTVLVRDNQNGHKSSSKWHDWYFALIFGGFLLIIVVLLLLYLLYRAKVRQQYKVTIPESTLLPVTPVHKSRVFDNAVYERDDDSGIIQPNTFQLFYESKNLTDIINNTNNANHNNNDKSKNKSMMNNSGVLLNPSALVKNNKSEYEDTRGTCSDGKGVKKMSQSGAKVKIENTAKEYQELYKKDDRELRPYSVERAENFPRTVHNLDNNAYPWEDADDLYNVPRQFNEGPIKDRWQNIGMYSSPGPQWDCGGKSPDSSPQTQGGYRKPIMAPVFVGYVSNKAGDRRAWIHSGSYDQNKDSNSRQKDRKRRSEVASFDKEHEYEDIESDHDFRSHRPTPKPRSVYNVQCETLKKRYAIPDGILQKPDEPYTAHSSVNQLYHRRSSDGLVSEQTRWEQPAITRSRFDQPRHSEGDISYTHDRNKHYSRCEMKPKTLSLYVSPEDMSFKSRLGQNPNRAGNIPNTNPSKPYSEPRIQNERQFPKDDNCNEYVTKPKYSSSSSPRGNRFDFFRPQGRHIYRNTDIEGFDGSRFSPKESRSPGRSKNKRDSGSFRRRSLVNLPSPPKVDRRRRKSEVMSEKLFGRKITNELRCDSETSVDKCWWTQDEMQETDVQTNDSRTLSSSAFV